MKILFVASEIEGLIKTGGLADFARALPAQLISRGHDVRVMTPKYISVKNIIPEDDNFIDFALNHSQRHQGQMFHAELDGIPLRLLEHHHFFSRAGIYDNGYVAYQDNPVRFAFLCKAAIVQCLVEDWVPDIIHCNDWQTALAPFYLNVHFSGEPKLSGTRSVLTIHNGFFQGKAEPAWTQTIGIPELWFAQGKVEHDGLFNGLKCGIYAADKINAVSNGYRNELLVDGTSHGLAYWYHTRETDFTGILNGCDYNQWNPETDRYLSKNYDLKNMSGKAECKKTLQVKMGLAAAPGVPVLGMVSRLTDQKGFDYLIPALADLLIQDANAQFIILGSGSPAYTERLENLKNRFGHKFAFYNGYNEQLSHEIEAGADFFMMPSLFEPCGLNQIYSMAYGTPPIVRLTGGLKDTVTGLTHDLSNRRTATGLTFDGADVLEMTGALNQAVTMYLERPNVYHQMQHNGMRLEFGWNRSAVEYESLYQEALLSERRFL